MSTTLVQPILVDHAGELLTLQRAAYVTEEQRYDDAKIAPLTQSLAELVAELRSPDVIALGWWEGHRLIGAVRLRVEDTVAHLGRLIVAPDRQGTGIGTALLLACEDALPYGVRTIRLFTGARSVENLRLYARLGYQPDHDESSGSVSFVHLSRSLPIR